MKPIRPLVRILHGSHLYGTNTPSSDLDYKSVHVPSGMGLLLQRPEEVIDRKVKLSDTIKNQPGDVDDQSYSLQKFLKMLAAGDTVATEILFATPLEADVDWELIQLNAHRFLNRQCRGFVGYCQRQAAKYGIKGSRMGAVKKLVDLLQDECESGGHALKLGDIEWRLKEFAAAEEHADWVNIPHPDGRECWHIECCDRKMPMTTTIQNALSVYEKVWDNYGERARAAMTNEGIDWKAVSHAVRVAGQAIELLTTGKITFPRPDADELLGIKLGKFPYSEVSTVLEGLVEEVNHVSLTSALPEASDDEFIDEILVSFHLEQING